jgi:nitrite reductase/ring-hydroxylating ferredoxin subunit
MNDDQSDGRRTFLRKSLGIAGGVALAATAPGLSGCEEVTLKGPTAPVITSQSFDITKPENPEDPDFSALAKTGGLIDIDIVHNNETLELMIFRIGPSSVSAMTRRCTHLKCDLALKFSGTLVDDDTVQCGCHTSRFNLATGLVEKGPATENLKTYPAELNGNIITITLE